MFVSPAQDRPATQGRRALPRSPPHRRPATGDASATSRSCGATAPAGTSPRMSRIMYRESRCKPGVRNRLGGHRPAADHAAPTAAGSPGCSVAALRQAGLQHQRCCCPVPQAGDAGVVAVNEMRGGLDAVERMTHWMNRTSMASPADGHPDVRHRRSGRERGKPPAARCPRWWTSSEHRSDGGIRRAPARRTGRDQMVPPTNRLLAQTIDTTDRVVGRCAIQAVAISSYIAGVQFVGRGRDRQVCGRAPQRPGCSGHATATRMNTSGPGLTTMRKASHAGVEGQWEPPHVVPVWRPVPGFGHEWPIRDGARPAG